ncbi:Curculin domain-containing protein (Mannose-binding) lectin OS=Streptomyces cyaneofuscatus OX=66883 GN=G3I52_10045 PE=4 SV=1 [Streptomyces cyaneofuscatus]
MDDLAYRDLAPRQILSAAREVNSDLFIVADKTALTAPEIPLLALLLFNENDECEEGEARQEHGELRVIATELWSVENNISLANMDWEDFENAADNGVFRGF